jgi:hypothetical protein
VDGYEISRKHAKRFCDYFTNRINIGRRAKTLRKVLGFIPFHYPKDGKLYYDADADFKTEEELYARKQEPTKTLFVGVEIFTAFYNEMSFVAGGREASSDEFDKFVIELDYFPEHLRPHVQGALESLGRVYRVAYIPFYAVYEYLGLEHIFGKYFIVNGDNIYRYQHINSNVRDIIMAKSGRLFDIRPPELHHFTIVSDEFIYQEPNILAFLTDNLIELFDLTKHIGDITEMPLTPFQAHILKYMLRRSGYAP